MYVADQKGIQEEGTLQRKKRQPDMHMGAYNAEGNVLVKMYSWGDILLTILLFNRLLIKSTYHSNFQLQSFKD